MRSGKGISEELSNDLRPHLRGRGKKMTETIKCPWDGRFVTEAYCSKCTYWFDGHGCVYEEEAAHVGDTD